MSQNATTAKSIKFFCMSPDRAGGMTIKSTFLSNDDGSDLTYSIDTGATGMLTVALGKVIYIYKMSDIVGRIEVAV